MIDDPFGDELPGDEPSRPAWGEVERGDDGSIVRLSFTVPGKPRVWQRARRGRHGPTYTPEEVENKMSEVRDAWRSLDVPPFSKETFLALGVVVYCRRPAGHFRTNGELKPWAVGLRPTTGTNGGDLSNFVKLVEDALNEVAYPDDAQIAEYLRTAKDYANPPELPRTEVVIEPLSPVSLAEVAGQEALIPAG